MSYPSYDHSAASSIHLHNSSRRLRRQRLQSRDNSDNLVFDRGKRGSNPNQQTSESRPYDDRRQSWLGIPKDIFKRQSLQLPTSYNLDNSSDTNTRTINDLPLQTNNVNVNTSPNSFAARSARNRLAVASMAYNTAPTAMPQTSGSSQFDPYADSIVSLDQSSICHSPTWGDEKSKRKQTGWAWKKSSNSKPKQEQGHDPVVKQSKRLNKKPPSAMETQRHSASLANGVTIEAPQMERRPSSSSGSFTQAMRGFLSRRSSQTSTPETSRPTSRSRPQSSSQEPKARQLSNKLSFDRTRQEDETYVSTNTEIRTSKVASSRDYTRETAQEIPPAQATIGPAPLSTPPQSSGRESKGPTPLPKSANDLPRATSRPTSIARMFGKRDNAAGGYKYPGRNKLTREHKPRSEVNPNSNTWLSQSFNNFRGNSSAEISQENASSQNMGGYVERERRVHQQRSIARFKDEIAVKSAYDQFLTDSQLPPTPQDSSESVLVARTEPTQELRHHPVSRLGRENYQSPLEPTISNLVPHQNSARSPQVSPGQNPSARSAAGNANTNSWSPKDNIRPGPGVIQLAKFAPRNQSLPTIPQQDRHQTADSQPSPKESGVRATSALTNTSSLDDTSHNMPSTYQLPPISASSTSPMLSAFLDQSIGAQSPPALNLDNNNNVQTNGTTTRKPVPANPAPEARTLGSKKKAEFLIASENAEGLTRKTSVKKSRSDPELKVPELRIDPPPPSDLPSLDFLPELKHQPLTKPKRTSRVSFAPGSPPAPLSPSQFPIPSPTTEVARRGATGLRTTKWSSISNGPLTGADAGPPKPIAKMFVICCKCKFWHDLPSKIYEAMALPQAVSKEDDIAADLQHRKRGGSHPNQTDLPNEQVKGLEGKIFTQVKCPWCEHGMSTSCCAGWTAVIYLHERHH
ncbi:MAG: hypothetical protein GOMPHAMPRED_004649 [Gomphillus americanus]|uniref:Uncharacterized protein n=1 Tax=Gomphillus americanus TaxID=1940652 RepID=A0A8H3FSJ1_9LECA|nr:MAG: hypothetical protein GOMPHAMPRED_004649 [Gomphillus americanus]